MSTVESTVAAPSRPETLVSFLALYRLLLRTQITVPRLLGIAALGALSLLLGVFAAPGRRLVGAGGRRRRLLLRARNPRPVRDALARHLGDRRPRRRPPARLPLAEARGTLAASGGGGARHGQRRRAADRGAARRVRPRRRSRRRRPRGVPRRVVRERSRTPACSSRPGSGSGAPSGGGSPSSWSGRTSSPTRRRARPASPSTAGRPRCSASRPTSTCPTQRVRCRRVRRPPRDRGRRLAGRDVALPPRRRRLRAAAQTTRPSSTQPLWPPRPIAFESATSSSWPVCFRSRASFGT